MTLYCYFVARAQPEIEALPYRTWNAEPLSFVRHGDLTAAVREAPAGRRSATQLMLEYNAVLATASKQATVLPLRFGTRFRGETAVVRLLAGRGTELFDALERLEGKVEMALRVRIAEPAVARDKASQIGDMGRPLDSWFEVCSNRAGETILELAHLIHRSEVARYQQRMKPEAMEVSGPWPPLHFLPRFLRLPVKAERRATGGKSRAAAAGNSA